MYHYQAVDERGRSRTGSMPAPDEPTLEQTLKDAGLWLTAVAIRAPRAATVAGKDLSGFKLSGKSGRRELIDFCTLMNFQIRAGITVVRALDVGAQDCKHHGFKAVLRELHRQIESGLQLHEALARYPRTFSTHFVSVIRAGEMSSDLPGAFDDLRAYLEWADDIRAQVRQASLYPAIVITVIFAFAIFLFTFIIPRFAALLDSLHVQQPLLTRIIFTLGACAKATWWLWLPLLFLLVIGIPIGARLQTLRADDGPPQAALAHLRRPQPHARPLPVHPQFLHPLPLRPAHRPGPPRLPARLDRERLRRKSRRGG